MDPLLTSIRNDLHADVQVVSETPRRHSRVLRVVARRDSGSERLFVKQVKLEGRGPDEREQLAIRVRSEYEILRRIYDSMQPDDRLGCIRPVACFPEHLALAMEEAPGHTLNVELKLHGRFWPGRKARERLKEDLHRVGLWMKRFQELTASPDAAGPLLERLRDEIDVFLATLVARPRIRFPSELGGAIRSFVDRAIGGARDEFIQVAGATGEVSPENMLLDDGRVIFVDFGMFSLRPSFSDPAMFYQHLHRVGLKPYYRPHVIAMLQRAFLQGYGKEGLHRHPLFEAYRIKYRLSRLDAESGRKWGDFDPIRKLLFRRWWRRERRDLARVVRRDA